MNHSSLPPPTGPRLRAKALPRGFEVVLVEPEIPPNTGNIGRLCAATRTPLHLVEPLGFDISEKSVRRAGLDYWPLLQLRTHQSWEQAKSYFARRTNPPPGRRWLLSGKAGRSYTSVRFEVGDLLIFGCESTGLPESLLAEEADRTLAIPTVGPVRSLNLSNAVSIVLYEALRQVGALDEERLSLSDSELSQS